MQEAFVHIYRKEIVVLFKFFKNNLRKCKAVFNFLCVLEME